MGYRYRDAREDDAERLAEIANQHVLKENVSVETMENLVQDRTIKVAEDGEEDEDDGSEVVGYVSYRVTTKSVVIQHLGVLPDCREGDDAENVAEELLEYPLRFAENEGMGTRVAVDGESWSKEVFEELGFERVGEMQFEEASLDVLEK
ncbi:MAG: GNAT family N-acetyltransferase [Halobacteria archaeon]|nr:GNAT family N-acetyltransferase [Halobacteria archaeon]